MANSSSRCPRELDEPATRGPPTEAMDVDPGGSHVVGQFVRRIPFQGRMTPFRVVVALEGRQLALEVALVPEHHVVEVLAPDRADHALDERGNSPRPS